MSFGRPIAVTGLGAVSRLGVDVAAHRVALATPPPPFRALAEFDPDCGVSGGHPAGWIEPPARLHHRKWSALSMAALHAAREALAMAGWSAAACRDAAVFFATSRGALSGWLHPRPGQKASHPLFAATRSLPAEPVACLAAELGLLGPSQVVSSGCCAGLDALGLAGLWLAQGLSPRALVVAADLPLVPQLLQAYRETGILRRPDGKHGMVPAEGAAAIALDASHAAGPTLTSYATRTIAADLFGAARRPADLVGFLRQHVAAPPTLIIPHASGTTALAEAEPEALTESFGATPALPLKPWTGHAVAASGLLEAALAADFLQQRQAPGHPLPAGSSILKLGSALGGKHSIITLHSHAS